MLATVLGILHYLVGSNSTTFICVEKIVCNHKLRPMITDKKKKEKEETENRRNAGKGGTRPEGARSAKRQKGQQAKRPEPEAKWEQPAIGPSEPSEIGTK